MMRLVHGPVTEMTLVELLIYTLATFRLVSLISIEKGPFEILRKLRRHIETGSFLDKLIECTWCVSIWVALGWVGLIALWPDVVIWIALPFALSAGAILVEGVAYDEYET
jgi:hypothetical protein